MLWHLSHLLFVVNAAVVVVVPYVVAAGQVTKQSGSKISVGKKALRIERKPQKKKKNNNKVRT